MNRIAPRCILCALPWLLALCGAAGAFAGTAHFTYDARGRLVETVYVSGGRRLFTLDATGNRTYHAATAFADTDHDALDDAWERAAFGNLLQDGTGDYDADGLSNREEYLRGTAANRRDTDGDGMADGWEVKYGLNPLARDGQEDTDGDGFSNLDEYLGHSDPTDPASTPRFGRPPAFLAPLLLSTE